MDINSLSLTELKALWFDQMQELTRVNNNIKIVEAAIIRIQEEPAKPQVEEPSEEDKKS